MIVTYILHMEHRKAKKNVVIIFIEVCALLHTFRSFEQTALKYTTAVFTQADERTVQIQGKAITEEMGITKVKVKQASTEPGKTSHWSNTHM